MSAHTPGPWFTDPNDATKVLKQFRSPKVRNETPTTIATQFDVTEALNAVQGAKSTEALQQVWKKHGAMAVAAQDKGGHAALKDAVKERKAELEGGAA